MRSASTTTNSATYVELSRHRAMSQSEQLAFSFLGAGNEATAQLSFEALDRRARAIAVELRRCCRVGDRALLLYPPGLDFISAFFGCLYAGVVATPAYPPRANQKTSRLRAIFADAQAAAVLTTESIRSRASELEEGWGASAIGWLATDTLGDGRANEWREPDIRPDALALLQYTSGSTGTPKGVMVSHENLLYNQRMLTAGFGTNEDSVIVSWLPLFHDMGLIGKMLHAHFVGVPCYLMSPMSFLKRPLVWLDAISRFRATLSGAPNFAYDLCVRRIPEEQTAGLDLSSWDVAFNASEPIRAATMQHFLERFACRGFRKEAFYPCYGLAEATVMVSGGVKLAGQVFDRPDTSASGADRTPEPAWGERAAVERVGCGRTVLDQEIRIVHPDTCEDLPLGQVGEVWVSGPHVARGYWQKPEETRETFQAELRGPSRDGRRTFLRTGDLGFLKGGELFITGRLKEILIIRGRNYYPQDLERTVEACHPALRPHGGAAFSVEVDDEERAVFVQEVVRSHADADFAEIFVAIRQAVTEEHDLHVHAIALIPSGSLPRTTSGKIQRRTCRRAYLNQEIRVLGEWHEFELDRSSRMATRPARHELLTLVGEARRRRLLKYLRLRTVYALGGLTPHLDDGTLSSLGLDSLASIELVSSIEDEIGVELPMSTLLDNATLPKICNEILHRLTAEQSTPEMVEPDAELSSAVGVDLPLSHGQRSMWFLNKLAPESAAYNVALTARIESTPDIPALERSLGMLVHRHPMLRTIFAEVDGEPVQRLLEQPKFALAKTDAWGWSAEALRAAVAREIERPFDLSRGPVFRAHLFCVTSPTVARVDKVLVLTAHHIVIDLWSFAVLLDELRLIYAAECSGRPLALEPAPDYLEFVRWQERTLAGPEGHRQWGYWSRQLAGELPTCELPTDHPRPALQTFRGSAQAFRIDAATTGRIEALARSQGATPFHTLFAVFLILLARHSGNRNLVVGTAAAGRKRTRFRRLVGYCVNPVLLRADLGDNPGFCDLLSQVRRTALDALDHQDLPFPRLVERLHPHRDPSRSPLFQIMFLMQKPHQLPDAGAFVLGHGDQRIDLGGLVLSPYPAPQPAAQFDLTMSLVPVGDELFGSLQYNRDLFEEVTIRRMVKHFEQLLASVVANPQQRIAEVSLMPRAESHRLLVEWNGMGWSGDRERDHGPLIHELFAAQAASCPEATAVECRGEELSYGELDARANRLAHTLRARGVGPESLVGICVERSPEMVVGLLGILKSGAGYLPLDPTYPAERLAFMMEDAGIAVLLSEEGSLPRFLPPGVEVACLPVSGLSPEEPAAPSPRVTAENLAYVLYTSGSTGRPKAVAIEHRSVVALLDWSRREFSREELGGVLAATSICFDLSVFELFGPLCSGGKVILARNALDLPQLPAAGKVTLVNTVPSAIAELLDRGDLPASVATVNLAGEPLKRELVDRIYAQKTVRAVRNLYGPSEDTTYSTGALIGRRRDHHSPAIGRPLLGTRAYLLDAQRRPVPTGVPGELYLGGAGVARGYLNRPELTADRFVPDPFPPSAGAPAGQRLYRTGDLARFLPDGNLEFLGRIDHQVKIRGFRIEPAEIESALSGHPAVVDVTIMAREDGPTRGTPSDLRLVAYVVARVEVSVSELRAFLREKMPEYMVPGVFVFLEVLPRTLNGKVNRRMLPAPDQSRPELDSPLIAPRSELERIIAGVWRDVLGLEEVGITDNFFDLGGHSLLLAKVRGELGQRLEWDLPIVDLFRHSTIRSLARHLSGIKPLRDWPPSADPPAQRPPEDERGPAATRITRRHSLKRQRQVRQQMRQQRQAAKGLLAAQ